MVFDVRQGNKATFIVAFYDATGEPTISLGATLTVTYTDNTTNNMTTAAVTLQPYYRFVMGTWDSTPAKVGGAKYAIGWGGASMPIADPNLRITLP